MSAPISDTTLTAYHHGRLPVEEAARVRHAIEQDEALQTRYGQLSREIEFLTSLLGASLSRPPPAVEQSIRATVAATRARRARGRSGLRRWTGGWRSLAASLLVVSGLGLALGQINWGSIGPDRGADVHLPALHAARADSRHDALEYASSGSAELRTGEDDLWKVEVTPIRTFRNAQGAFCREFIEIWQVADMTHGEVGVACREQQGGWRNVAVLQVH